MGGTTISGPASTYWRRRFFVLVAGLMISGLAAWGLSDALAVGASRIVHNTPSIRPTPAPAPSPVALGWPPRRTAAPSRFDFWARFDGLVRELEDY